jgi:hypothetical protein
MVDEMQELADRDSWRLLNSTLNCGMTRGRRKSYWFGQTGANILQHTSGWGDDVTVLWGGTQRISGSRSRWR